MLEIKIPNEYSFDNECLDLLVNHLKEYIIYQSKRYTEDGFIIYLHNTYFRIKYIHHIFKVTIVKQKGLYYYYLQPYKKEYFVTLATSPNVFEIVLQAIKESYI